MKHLKRLGLVFVGIIGLILAYVIYMQANYYRIEDNLKLEVTNNKPEILQTGEVYSAMTYNIGFGAYNHDFSFFMDSGTIKEDLVYNGKTYEAGLVNGKNSKAKDEETVLTNTNGVINVIKEYDPDFVLLQEVDKDSTRSHHINQVEMITNEFDYAYSYASNFHTGYMLYPFNDPHGKVESGLLTLSKYQINDVTRRSYEIATNFVTKFFDLDRCFTINRLAVDNGKELVLIHSHMSAYDEGGVYRQKQLDQLTEVMNTEYNKGNYVIVTGDFNHALLGSVDIALNSQGIPDWVSTLDDTHLPSGFEVAKVDNLGEVNTVRSTEIPYVKGFNYETIVDGFLVSDNITYTATNIDTNFEYSDHNPVLINFTLK